MPMNRVAAIDYARRFWNRPCDDGVFWLTNQAIVVEQKRKQLGAPAREGWEAFFQSDGRGREHAVFQRTVGIATETKVIQPWEGLADCAHYLSRCLQAGGIKVSELGVPGLVSTLQARPDTKTLAEKVPQAQGQQIVNSGVLKAGDMIGYFNVDPAGDFGGARNYSHSTMYVGKLGPADPGRVTCHTISRFPGLSFVADQWYLHSGYTYTFIHFSSDDSPPSPGLGESLVGWWKIQYGGRTEYYYIFKDGRARYTLKAPTAASQQLNAPDGSAYWFQQFNRIVFLWRKTGTFEVWTAGSGARDYRITVNGTPGTAVKLF